MFCPRTAWAFFMATRLTSFGQKKQTLLPIKVFLSIVEKVSSLTARKKIAFLLVIILVIIIGVVVHTGGTSRAVEAEKQTKKNQTVINKSFDFTGYDNRGLKRGKLKFTITTAEKATDVLVNNQTFQAKNGKLFLLLNLEYTNDSKEPQNIVPDNLVRLIYNGDADKKFSADLHNNAVSVAAISTKTDRIGFVIPYDAKNFILLVGELDGKKEEVALPF